jgi:hypothetical protein
VPSDDGKNIDPVLPVYKDYILEMFETWVPNRPDGKTQPMVVFGSPARNWMNTVYNLNLKLLSVATVSW